MSTTHRSTRRFLLAAAMAVAATGSACTPAADKLTIPALNNSGTPVATNITAVALTSGTTGNAQKDSVGLVFPAPMQARVNDQNGNPMVGATVSWTVSTGGGTLAAATTLTDDGGVARNVLTAGSVPRADTVTATITTATGPLSAIFTETVIARGATVLVKISGDLQSIAAGSTSAPMVVQTNDPLGNPNTAKVTWAVVGGGTLSASSTTTSATTGQGSVTLLTTAVAGTYTVTATLGTQTQTFTITTH